MARRRRMDFASRRRRKIFRWCLAGLGVLGVLLALPSFRVLQIANDLRNAKTQLESAEALLKEGRPAAARAALAAGERRVTHANSIVHGSPELGVLNFLPVARQNLDAMKTSVGVALRLAGGGRRLLESAQPLETAAGTFEVPLRAGDIPLPIIRSLRPQLEDLAVSLPLVRDAPDSGLLLSPVKTLVDTVFRQADLRKRQLTVVGDGLTLLSALSGDNNSSRLLLAVANAAEMRGTGGMMLSYGELVGTEGKFTLERFGGVDDIPLPSPAPVELPADYAARFASLGPTLNWRNATLGGDFTYLGRAMIAMYRQATGKVADGVLQIDSFGLAAMLKGTGPVDVPGLGTVTADNVVALTLSDAYARFSSRTERQEVLGDVAEAVFRRLVTGNYASLRPLAAALVDAAGERRLLLHMSDPLEQRTVAKLGIDGSLPALGTDFAMLSVQNFSANKLDYYLDSTVRLTGDRVSGRVGRLQAEVTITNRAPQGQTSPQYVFGPNVAGQIAGQYVGLASLYLPRGAGLAGQTGNLSEGAAGVSTEADRAVISVPIRIAAGQTLRFVLNITLPPAPDGAYLVALIPVSRVRPTAFSVNLDRGPAGRLTYTGAPTRVALVRDISFSDDA